MRERHLAPRKVFCVDNGIVSSVSSGFSANTGRLMENLVAVELRRRCAREWDSGVFYWKDHRHNEVDFVVKRGTRVDQLVQVTYAGEGGDVRDRELRSLLKASSDLRCRDLLVITWDHEEERQVEGRKVAFVPLWRWLLEAPTGLPGGGRGGRRGGPRRSKG
jgi:predicted AAA+ superfamily ATPase